MYHHILIPLENTPADETILTHIKPLARMTGAKLFLVHVSDCTSISVGFRDYSVAVSARPQDRGTQPG